MNCVVLVFGETAAPYLIGGAFGLAAGAWVHYFATKLDNLRQKN